MPAGFVVARVLDFFEAVAVVGVGAATTYFDPPTREPTWNWPQCCSSPFRTTKKIWHVRGNN